MTSVLCGAESSLLPIKDGVMPLCFQNVVLFGLNALFILVTGSARIHKLRATPKQDLRSTKLHKTKIFVCILLALLSVLHSVFYVTLDYNLAAMHEILADFFNCFGWMFVAIIAILDYSRGLRNNWAVRTWWTTTFILSAFTLQTAVWHTQETGHKDVNYVFAILIFPLCFFVAVVGLFFNKITEEYERILDASVNNSDLVLEDKKTNPEKRSNIISKLTFSWLNPLLLLGYKRPLEETDIYELPSGFEAAELGENFERIWRDMSMNYRGRSEHPSLWRAMFKAYGFSFCVAGVYKLIQDLLMFLGPWCLQQIIYFVQHPDTPVWQGIAYVVLLFVGSTIQSLALHKYFFIGFKIGMMARSALIACVYRKAFHLSNKARQQSTLGEIVNLQAIDASRLQELFPYLHMLWSAPLQIAVSLYMLCKLLGYSVIAGILVMILMIPLNGFITKKLMVFQKVVMKLRDSRTKTMNEILNGIRIIKFFAWESSFVKRVGVFREQELQQLKASNVYKAFSYFVWSAAPTLVSVATFALFTLTGHHLTPEVAFTSIALFNIMRFPLNVFPSMISQLAEAKVSFNRLAKFLNNPELDRTAVERHSAGGINAIEIENGSFQWDETAERPTLSDINLKIPNGKMVAVVGTVGCGKSSLLAAMLGEIPKLSGKVVVRGEVAYVAQQAWIQNATLRDNILFGMPYDVDKYETALRVCELRQDIAMLPNGDMTEIGEKGINLSGGQKQRVSMARAVYQNLDLYLLDDSLSAVDAHVGKKIFDNCITGVLKNKTRVLVTHQLQFVSYADVIVVIKDGRVSEMGSYEQLMSSGQEFCKLIKTHLSNSDKYEKEHETEVEPEGSKVKAAEIAPKPGAKIVSVEEREIGRVDSKVWKAYAIAMGGFLIPFSIVMTFFIDTGSKVGSDVWLSVWSTDNDDSRLAYYLGIYCALGLGSGALVFIRSYLINIAGINSARKLHDGMLKRVIRAPMSFFDTTPIGRILNRFSKDINTLDEALPRTLAMFIAMLFGVLSVVVVIVAVTPFFITALLPLAFSYRHVQKYYLQSSRELKRLESISKSPIFAQFSETLNGLSTIRPYNRESTFVASNNAKMDLNLAAYYALTAANRWLGIRLEFMGTAVVTVAAGFAVFERENLGPGFAGLSISYALQLTGVLNWLVRMATEAETQMVSVERVKQYAELPQEPDSLIPEKAPPKSWPAQGRIEMKNVSLRYREGLDLVLRGLTVELKGREKVGVVGRTGAGKSSLMLALFRLVELAEGQILIDGIDISTIGLDDLRKKLSIIPQDPVLFTGTVRENLDPFGEHSDLEIWNSLTNVYLRTAIEALPNKLDSPVTEFGENFSVGQRQLMCLGRAMLKNAKILVMDEATASVDLETDSLIQKTIRESFNDVTVLTIAHRINTIMDYDRVLVLDKGQLAEFDSPSILAKDPKTIFYQLVNKSGTVSEEDASVE